MPPDSTPAECGQYVEETFKTSDLESQSHSTSDASKAPAEPQKKKRKLVAGGLQVELEWVAPHAAVPQAEPSSEHGGSHPVPKSS
ncbi:hypothetical protein BDR03DRAFT_1016922 [Suillus americanus]|nr:hypothetical protein BDR03DRAFT_1016922 [Suillus americanus]